MIYYVSGLCGKLFDNFAQAEYYADKHMKAAPEGQGQGASLAEEDQYKAAIGSGPL